MTTTVEPDVLDPEHSLICRLLTDPTDWGLVNSAQITPDFFANGRHRKVFARMREFAAEYGELPDVDVLRQDFPRGTYDFIACDTPVQYLIDELCHARKGALLEAGLEEATTAWEQADYNSVLHALAAATAEVYRAVPIADDMDLTQTGDERLAWYMERQERTDGLIGSTTGYRSLDTATGGLQPEQLITITGFAKHGKSDLALDVARAVHLNGEHPLFIGFEMSNREQAERYDARRAGISLTHLRNGELSEDEWLKLKRSVESLKTMHPFILSADRTSTLTLSGVQAKVDQIRPTVLIVDGTYMMEDENGEAKGSSQALTNLTRGFKRMAQKNKIPVVITTQSLEWKGDRKKGLTRGSIGYSSSFIQDSDVVIGIEKTDADPRIQIIKILGARNCPPQDFYIRRDWELGTVEELDYNPFETDGGEGEDDYGDY